MKQWKKTVCAALAAACTVCAAGAADATGSLTPQGARAYAQTLDALQQSWGAGQVAGAGSPFGRMWTGLSLARLIDFDGDGTPELYAAAGRQGQRLYTYANGAVQRLAVPEGVSNFGTDVSPSTLLYVGDGRAFLVSGSEVMNGSPVTYYTKQGGGIVQALQYTAGESEQPDGVWGISYTVNGSAVTEQAFRQALDELTAGMTEYDYSFWDISDADASPRGTVDAVRRALAGLTDPTAKPSTNTVTVDGAAVPVAAYKINGSNYFKLRDVAFALAQSEKRFAVEWDAAAKTARLVPGAAYLADGSENAALPAGAQPAALTNNSILLDGAPLGDAVTVYKIAGSNYCKLRDLGAALGFSVGWDEASGAVQIGTGG